MHCANILRDPNKCNQNVMIHTLLRQVKAFEQHSEKLVIAKMLCFGSWASWNFIDNRYVSD